MARRRGRKDSGLLELVLTSEWPVATVMAVLTVLIGFWMLPAWFAHSAVFAQLSVTLRPAVWLLFGFFSLTALIKCRLAVRAVSKRRMGTQEPRRV